VGAQDVSNLPGTKTRRFQRVLALMTYSAHFDLTFRDFCCHERHNADQGRYPREYATLGGAASQSPADRHEAGGSVCLGDVLTIIWILGR
jgi:hypothetical protein